MRLIPFACLAFTALGCQSKNAPAPAKATEVEPTKTASSNDECVVPTADALARFEGLTEDRLSIRHDTDFNGDGQSDAIVRVQGGREPTHLLYIRERGCIRFLDKVEAFSMGCEGEPGSTGYCDIWVETWLMHGDRKRTIMVYGEGGYQALGEGELIPGPRDTPK